MSEITLRDGHSFLILLYIIDLLDSLDLTYLSKFVRRFNEKLSPRWSRQRLNGESEYFHVTIADKRIDEEDCYFESLDTYTCHICNLNVPKIYYNQHNASKQHETCKKINEKVLERVAKQINSNIIDNDWDDTKNLYYCAPCSRAVNLKNKHQHESSNYHKKSEEKISIIKDFYHNIIEDSTRINSPSEHSYDESNSDSDESETQDTQHYTVNNKLEQMPNIRNDLQKEIVSDEEVLNVISVSDKNKDVFAKIQELQTASQLETTELSNGSTSEQHQPFDAYLKEMISKFKLDVSTPVTDGEYIIIVSPNGDKVKVSREHFHSYRHINKRVYCLVCNIPDVHTIQDTRHEYTENHVRNIFKIVNEKYARKIDPLFSHCLICNELIPMESDHQNISDVHKNLLVDAKIQQNTENIDGKTVCDICNMQDLKSHNNSMEHSGKEEANADMLEVDNIVKINCSEYFCNSCKINLDSNTLNDHINNRIHINKLPVPNNVIKAEYCEICKVEVSQELMKAHSFTECFKDVIIKAVSDVIKTNNEELKKYFLKYVTHNKPSLTNTAQNESLTFLNETTLTNTAQNESFNSQNKSTPDTALNESSTLNKPSLTNTVQNESITSENKPLLTDTAPTESFTSKNKPSPTDTVQSESFTSQNIPCPRNTAQNQSLTSENKPLLTDTAPTESFTSKNKPSPTDTVQSESFTSQNIPCPRNTAQNQSLTSENKPSLTDTAQNESFTFQNKPSPMHTAQNENLSYENKSTLTNTAKNESSTSLNKPTPTDTEQKECLASQNKIKLTDTAQDESLTSENETTYTNITRNERLTYQKGLASADTAQNKSFTSTSYANTSSNSNYSKHLYTQTLRKENMSNANYVMFNSLIK